MRLAALVVEDTFRILEHLLPPQVEKVVGIRVELETVLTIVPVNVELVEWRRFVAMMIRVRHGCWDCLLRDDLLVKDDAAAESLAQMNVL